MQSLSVSPAVQAFVSASETMLSPVTCPPDLTREECELIAEYVMSLSNVKTPRSRYLISRYT